MKNTILLILLTILVSCKQNTNLHNEQLSRDTIVVKSVVILYQEDDIKETDELPEFEELIKKLE